MSLTTRALTIASLGSAVVAGSLLHPVVSGQVTHTTHMGGPIGEGLLPTAGVFVAVALLLGLVAYHEHIPTMNRLVSSRTTKRVGTLALAGLIVSAAALGGVGGGVGSAQAAYGFQDCTVADSLIGAALQSFTNPQADGECRFNPADVGNPNGVAATDGYAAGLAMSDATDSYLTTSENFDNATYGVMLMEAKISIIESLENNETNETARAEALAAVENVSQTRMSNIIHNYNGHAQHYYYLTKTNTSVRIEGSSASFINKSDTVTFNVSGSNESVFVWGDDNNGGFSPTMNALDLPGVNNSEYSAAVSANGYQGHQLDRHYQVNDPSNSSVWTTALDAERYGTALTKVQNNEDTAKANVDQLVTDIYASYNAGELNATDLAQASPLTMATQASTDLNSTGYYGFAAAQASALGISTDTNASHVVRHDWTRFDAQTDSRVTTTVNTTGTLFYTGEDSPALSTGSTVDPANHSGEFYMAVSSMEGVNQSATPNYVQMDGTFEILSATNTKTGEPINTTTMEPRPEYSTTNVSNLQDQIDELQKLRDYYKSQQAASGGGFSFDFGGVETGVILALLAVAFLATRD
jgi:hypothetical protein